MSRVLEIGMRGADVVLLQRDLNVWYRYWDAPASEYLDEDGDLGKKTGSRSGGCGRGSGCRSAWKAGACRSSRATVCWSAISAAC